MRAEWFPVVMGLTLPLCWARPSYAGGDGDGDGVPDATDECPNTPADVLVDGQGRPVGDLDQDCDTDLADFAMFLRGFTGALGIAGSDAGPGELVIVEVMRDPAAVADTAGEWFEIVNVTNRVINLAGLTFADAGSEDFLIPLGRAVPILAGARFVLGRNGNLGTNGGVTVNYVYSGLTLGNTADEIIIRNGTTVIDEIAWDSGAVWPDPVGASMILDGSLNPATANNNSAANWCASVRMYGLGDRGTPGAANDDCVGP